MKSWTSASTAMAMTLFGAPAYAEDSLAEDTPRRSSEDIIVTAKIEGYNAPDASSATRTNTPLLETPQSVSVIPRQVIEDLSATRVEEALDYAGGFVRGNNFGGQFSNYTLRGFSTAEYFRNGFPFNRGVTGAIDSITIERLDVLRGPAALLYGRGDPGGTFNIVTRRAEAEASYDVSARVNTYGAWRGAGSATGGLTADGALRYRLSAAVEDGGGFRDHVDTTLYLVAPVVAWNPGENTTITLDTQFMQVKTMFDRGLPHYAGQNATRLSRSFFMGEPSVGRWRTRNGTGQLRIDHRLGGDWTLSGGVQYYKFAVKGPVIEGASLRPDGRTLTRSYSIRDINTTDLNAQASLAGTLTTGGVEHTLLFGLEYDKYHYDQITNGARTATHPFEIDILNPVYGQPLPPLFLSTDIVSEEKAYAAYAQDQIGFTSWLKLLAGVRVEHFKSYSGNNLAGTNSGFKQTVVTPRLGVVVLPVPHLSIYGSYTRSNKPNSSFDRLGRVLDPERGTSYEAGVKLDMLDHAFSITAAVFHTVKQNVATPDPDDITNMFNIAAGEVRSRGFDVIFSGELVKGWRLTGGYAYADAKVTKDNSLPVGLPLANAPRHSASALSVYEFQDGPLQGLGLGAGMIHVGDRTSATARNAFTVSSYTIFNLLAYYDLTEKIRLQANVNNLFDKRYDERAFRNFVFPGAPLHGVVSLSARF